MSAIVQQKCVHHRSREAVARCPECRKFYCRECVTEHSGRMICASCLKRGAAENAGSRNYSVFAVRLIQSAAGILILWSVFYYMGQALLLIPSSVHEGTLWEKIGNNE